VSLRARLLAAIGIAAILSVALALAIGAYLTRQAVERNTLRDVSAQADLLADRERSALLPFSPRTLNELRAFLDQQGETIELVKLDGSSPYLPPERAILLRRGVPLNGTLTVDGERSFYAARLVAGKGFVLLRPTDVVTSSWRPHVRGLLIGAAAAATLAALAAFFLARAISRPVRRVSEAARTLAHDESPEPIPVEGARELAVLAESFNESAAALAQARAAERQFLLSVSHELKTPLTAIRGYAEGLADGVLDAGEAAETIGREAVRLERLVKDLLDLARMNKSEFSVQRVPIDLGEIGREVSRRYEAQAQGFDVDLQVDVREPAPAVGDVDRMVQVVSNLVENALRVTPAGGTVRIVARPGSIAVEDNGPGLREEELPRAFERFYLYSRYGRERPVGTGLGLAIVKQLAEGMGGSVEASSVPGLTRFVVRLRTPGTFATVPELAHA
jgi:two-component system sensor histidine kinase BaeS